MTGRPRLAIFGLIVGATTPIVATASPSAVAPEPADALAPPKVGSATLTARSATALRSGDRATITIKLSSTGGKGPHEVSGQVPLPAGGHVIGAVAQVDEVRHTLGLMARAAIDELHMTVRTDGVVTDEVEAPAASVDRSLPGLIFIANGDGYLDGTVVRALLPDSGAMSIAVSIDAPTCFWRDARYVRVPTDLAALLRAGGATLVTPAAATASGLVAACTAAPAWGTAEPETMAYLAFAAPELATAASGQARVGTLGARVVGETTQVAGVELALASVLADVPADLHTVLLVDRSRSITPAQAAAQLDVIRAYLAATPDRQVALIGFDRVATPLTKGFVRSSALRRAAPALLAAPTRNGSDVGAAVAAAGRLLTEVAGTGRVIILSDDLVASTVPADVAPWASQLPLGTLVHTVALDELGGSVLQRDDDVRFATLAARTQGIGLRLERAPVPADPDARPPALDATILTRPIAVDHLRLVGTAWSPVYDSDMAARCLPGAGDTPVSMGAGTSCRWLGAGAADAPASIDLVGELWGAPWTRTVALDTSRGPGLARDLVDNLGALDADLHPHVTSAAAAVTSFHGLVTRWGGSGGYGLGLEGGGTGSSICGCDGRALPLGVTGTVGRGTLVAAFPDLIAAQIARCRLTDATVALAIETTRDELVAIDATITRRLSARATTDDEACVEAALWDAAMTVPGGDEFHAWSFELRY